MKVSLIAICFIAYLIIGAILSEAMAHLDWEFDDDDQKPLVVMFWPLFVPGMLLYKMCKFFMGR